MRFRNLVDEDYDNILKKWWEAYGFVAPPKDFLPMDGGMMVEDKGVPVCAAFIYATNAKVAWIDWVISNKDYADVDRKSEALDLLIETLERVCANAGYRYCYVLVQHDGLVERFAKYGYQKGETYRVELIKRIV